ncbi:4522_t:CDS:2 [Paraglomus occultum]|uniref:4522_t:CDS:1 n=1 Tax=Paraglomus occultum TaxID=144539 RepID=A0A9N9DJK5_9GLOM|nr:4522_t:CDS:2 [Paraglomus occultum]
MKFKKPKNGKPTAIILINCEVEEIDTTNLRISYSTENSLEKELNKSTNTDILIIAISYLEMFLYASIALGKLSAFPRLLIDSKFTPGICVFAVGVDNIFILNHEFEKLTLKSMGDERVEERIAKTLMSESTPVDVSTCVILTTLNVFWESALCMLLIVGPSPLSA